MDATGTWGIYILLSIDVHCCPLYEQNILTSGWNLQRSRWHNPFSVKECGGSRAKCLLKYMDYLLQPKGVGAVLLADVASLRGKVCMWS